MDETSKNAFCELLKTNNWNSLLAESDAKAAFDLFFETIDSCFDLAFHEIIIKSNKNKRPINPWMTEGILMLRKTKQKSGQKDLFS